MNEANDRYNRQRPLSLKWASKGAAEYLKQHAGLDAGAAAIAFDLASTPEQEVSYPRAKGHGSYVCARRYKSPIWTPGNVIGGMDQLDQAGLIDHVKRLPGNRSAGMQSYARAKPELVQMVKSSVLQEPLRILMPRENIILRDSEKNLLDYRETRETSTMRKNLATLNEGVLGEEIENCEVAAMVRYFNRTLQRGGRFIAKGNSWQNMASSMRHQVKIAGEETTELDFKCLHPAILYSMANATMPSDAYDVPGWPRDLVKRALLVVINAQNKHQAIAAIAHSDGRKWERDEGGNPIAVTHERQLMQVIAEPGSDAAKQQARILVDELCQLHKPIAKFFGKDMGAKLMRIDSQIAEAVMIDLHKQGIVVLPVHDSFLVPMSKADMLEAAMHKAAHAQGLQALKIERKTPPPTLQPKQLFLL